MKLNVFMRNRVSHVILALILMFLLASCAHTANATADALKVTEHTMLENLQLVIDGGSPRTLRTLHYSYANNRFVSLRDIAASLSGTAKQFDLSVSNGATDITTNMGYEPVGGENTPFEDQSVYKTGKLSRNPISLDGREMRYYGFIGYNSAGKEDCFLNLTDIAMMMDLSFVLEEGTLFIDTSKHFVADLQESLFFDTHSAIVGDADTGEIYCSWEPDLSVPIASTTKLMTYVVLMDCIEKGTISADDMVTITKEAEVLSRSDDGEIEMGAQQEDDHGPSPKQVAEFADIIV